MIWTAILKVLLLAIGFVLLVKGADFFVDGASGIAQKLKISTFIIGVTVVALGTSAPEAAVTVIDATTGSGNLIIGNILGSNVINILLILGISAVICNLPIERMTKLVDLPVLLATSALFIVFGYLGGSFVWWEGLILLILYFAYMAYNIVFAIKQSALNLDEHEVESTAEQKQPDGFLERVALKYEQLKDKLWFLIIITVLGLATVVGGAQLVVSSAEYIAIEVINIPAEIVALTVVAFGTSLPELVTSVSAAKKGDVGIATGNIIGSNIANILLIGGIGAVCKGTIGLMFTTEGIVSGAVALFAAIIIFVCAFTKKKAMGKVAGYVMLFCLIAYYVFLFLNLYILHLYV